MSFIFTKNKDVEKMVKENFGKSDNYLIAFKHNGPFKSLFKLFLSNLYYIFDNTRTYVLYFDKNGIHEKEISVTDNAAFILIPYTEIVDFKIKDKGNKYILEVNHLGKIYSYEVCFDGKLFSGNDKRFNELNKHNFYREISNLNYAVKNILTRLLYYDLKNI